MAVWKPKSAWQCDCVHGPGAGDGRSYLQCHWKPPRGKCMGSYGRVAGIVATHICWRVRDTTTNKLTASLQAQSRELQSNTLAHRFVQQHRLQGRVLHPPRLLVSHCYCVRCIAIHIPRSHFRYSRVCRHGKHNVLYMHVYVVDDGCRFPGPEGNAYGVLRSGWVGDLHKTLAVRSVECRAADSSSLRALGCASL